MFPYGDTRCVANILEHDHRLFETNSVSKLVACICKAINKSVHGFPRVGGKCSIVRKEQFYNENFADLRFSSKTCNYEKAATASGVLTTGEKIPNSVGARSQPFFTPFLMRKGSEHEPSN